MVAGCGLRLAAPGYKVRVKGSSALPVGDMEPYCRLHGAVCSSP